MSESAGSRGKPLALLLALPADVWLILAGLADAYLAVMLPPGNPARILITLLTLLILPGYALTTAAFPAKRSSRRFSPMSVFGTAGESPFRDRNEANAGPAALTGVERAALSFGLSVALVPVFGAVLYLTDGGFRLRPLLVVLTTFVLLATAIGVIRRSGLPADRRYEMPVHDWIGSVRSSFANASGVDLALNVALALALLISASTLAFAIAAPQDGSQFTEAYLLAPQGDGEFAAKNYPTEFNRSENRSLAFVVENQEGQTVSYTVIAELQRLDSEGNVLEDERVARFEQTVAAGESWRNQHAVTPTLVGERLRLSYLVYRGDPPAEISRQTAYRDVSIRINVSASSASGSITPSASVSASPSISVIQREA